MEGLRYKLYYSGENRIRSEPFILEFTQEFLLKRLLQSSLCLLTLYLLMCTNIGKSTPVAWHLRKNHWTIPCTEKRKMDDIKSNIIAGYRKIVNADMKWVRKILKCPFFHFSSLFMFLNTMLFAALPTFHLMSTTFYFFHIIIIITNHHKKLLTEREHVLHQTEKNMSNYIV